MIKTINISMSDDDLEDIDGFCKAHNLTRSKFMVQSSIQALNAEKMASATMCMVRVLENFNREGKLNAEDQKQLDKIQDVLGVLGWRSR